MIDSAVAHSENLLPAAHGPSIVHMSTVTAEAAAEIPLPEVLSWDEMVRRYPNEWVILVDMIKQDFQTVAGRVVAHGPDKHALVPAMHEAMRLHGHMGRFFTGIPRFWKIKSHVARHD